MKNIIKNLEKEFFEYDFDFIKNHPKLSHLKLSDNEIIDYRNEIRSLIKSEKQCSSKNDYCLNIGDHYEATRAENKSLVFKTYECNKKKEFNDLNEKEIDKKLKSVLSFSDIKFTHKEAKTAINRIYNTSERPCYVKETLVNLGNPKWSLSSSFIKTEYIKENSIVFAYSTILSNKSVLIVRTEKLKKAILDFSFSFDNAKDANEKELGIFKNIYHLIIIDFGLEHDIGYIPYILDYFSDFIYERHEKKLITSILTSLGWEEIKQNITKKPKFTIEKQAKLSKLEKTFAIVFSNNNKQKEE